MPLTDPVPSSAFDVLERNIQDTDKFVNQESGTFTNRVGKVIKPIPVIEAEANAAVISLGWHQVGLFAGGFTYTLQNDIAKDAAGDWYRWNGTLPKVVTAGTLPSSDVNFVKIDYKSHAELSNLNADGGHDAIYARTYANEAELSTAIHSVGEFIFVGGAQSGEYEITSTGTVDNIDVFAISGGLFAVKNTSLAGDQYYSYKQRYLLAESLKKLRDKTPITFTWYGDSNSVRNAKEAQTSFRGMLQTAYGASSTNLVIDRATSGFSAKNSFESYTSNHAGDISIINFGTNDATTQEGYPSLDGNVQQYLFWMEKLIVRELNWGHACVLVTPLPVRFDKGFETYTTSSPSDPFPTFKRIDSYLMGESLKYLAKKYSIPLIDSVEAMAYFKDEMFANSTQSIKVGTPFGDVVHLQAGYSGVWGSKIAMQFIGDVMLNAKSVGDGDMLVPTHGASSFALNSPRSANLIYQYYADPVEGAFAQGDDHVGNRAMVLTTSESITFSFYASTDNLIVVPTMMTFANSNVEVFVGNKKSQPPVKIDNSVYGTSYGPVSFTEVVGAVPTSGTVVNRPVGLAPLSTRSEQNKKLWITSKGWNTVTILVNSGSCAISGLNIQSLTTNLYLASQAALLAPVDYGQIASLTSGDIQDSEPTGLMTYAYPACTGFPAGATGGSFIHQDNSISNDNSVSIIRFYESAGTAGRVWTKFRLGGVWGAWVQA